MTKNEVTHEEVLDLDELSTPKKGLDLQILQHEEIKYKATMTLACWVLGAIFSVLVIAIITHFIGACCFHQTILSDNLFELWKSGLLPIITFILGFYFSKK